MISREEWKGLNFKKIEEYQKDIETYDGNIPYALYDFITISNRTKYLNRTGNQYEYAKIKQHRKQKPDVEEDINEILEWVNNNPLYEDIIRI